MESFLSMKQKLLPLGLYELDDNDETVWELKAYAEGLNTLFDTLDELEREYFISTAQSYGLSRRELLFGREMSGQTAQERRGALMYLERTIVGDTTDSGFAEFLENLGLSDYTLNVNPGRAVFTINIADQKTDGEKALIEERIRAEVPLYMNCTINFTV